MSGAVPSLDLTDVPARDWQKARRRFSVIRDLAELADRTRDDAETAAAELDLSLSQLYRLLARYQADPRLTSLLPEPPGRKAGWISCRPKWTRSSTRRSTSITCRGANRVSAIF